MDFNSAINLLLERLLEGHFRWLTFGIFLSLLLTHYNFFTSLFVMKDHSLMTCFWSTSASGLFLAMAEYEIFDEFFVSAGEFFAILLTYIWALLFTSHRKWMLYLLQFEANFRLYQKSLYTVEEFADSAKLSKSLTWQLFRLIVSKNLFRCAYQLRLLSKNQDLLIRMKEFEENRRGLALYSTGTLVKTAALSDAFHHLLNAIWWLFALTLPVAFVSFRFYFRFGSTYAILVNLIIYPWLLIVCVLCLVNGVGQQLFAYAFHLREVNDHFRKFQLDRKYDRKQISGLLFFISYHVITSGDLERNHSPAILFVWFYWITLFNSYLLYRMFFLDGPYLFVIINSMFFAITTFSFFYSFAALVYIHKQFYRHRKRMLMVVGVLDRKQNFGVKLKVVGFFEHQTAKRFKSGYKMFPNILVNSATFLRFALLYLVITIQFCNFFFFRKKAPTSGRG